MPGQDPDPKKRPRDLQHLSLTQKQAVVHFVKHGQSGCVKCSQGMRLYFAAPYREPHR